MANTTLKAPNQGDVHADELFDLERRATAPNTSADLAAQDQRDAAMRDSSDTVREQESSGSWANNVSNVSKARDKAKNLKNKGRMTGGRRKKLLAGLGIGGGAGTIVAIIMMLLPLKAEMFIQNITKHAMAVPGYAIEHRAEYLITRAIASRMLAVGYGDTENKVVFCTNGSIACSLYKTYTTDFIEKKFGITFKSVELNKKVEITTTDRTRLGGKGKSWRIDISRINPTPGMPDVTLTKVIESNSEMKAYIKNLVSKDITDGGLKGQIKRFIARKVEMRKYGVTSWRAFEKVGAKIDDIKTSIRSSIIKNVFGRFSSRLAIYMGCLDSVDTCQKTIDKVDPDRTTVKQILGDSDLAADAEKATGKDMTKVVMEALTKTAVGNSLKVASKAIPVVGWGLLIDMYMKIIKAVDSGVVDQIIGDVVKGTYMAYTYGDNAGIVPNIEKLKAGDLDMNTLSVLSSMFDGAEKSPLMAAENGITNTAMATLFGGTTAYAADSSSSSSVKCPGIFGAAPQPILRGQLVCSNQMTVQNITGFLHTGVVSVPGASASIPGISQAVPVWWSEQVGLAELWNHSIGYVADIINGIIGGISDLVVAGIPQPIKDFFSTMASQLSKLAQTPITWFLQTVFGIPNVGMDATGDQNYVALSGGIRTESNELMENGQDADGTPSGAGGQYLTPQQVSDIYKASDMETPKSSYLASLFDPYVTGSLTQQLALLAPSDGIGLIGTLLNTPASILSGFGASASAADTNSISSTVANNPFNEYVYGYPVNATELTADPNNYTAATCTQSAAARESSYGKVGDNPTPTYSVSDPCALEKTVVGGLLADAGVTDDPNSLKDPLTTPASGSGATSAAGATIDMAHAFEDSTSVGCAPGTTEIRNDTGYNNGQPIPIKLCSIPGTIQGPSDGTFPPGKAGAPGMVNSRASGAALAMFTQMKTDLGLGSVPLNDSFRTYAEQEANVAIYGGQAAPAGYSNHQMGYAFDMGGGGCSYSSGITSCPSSAIWTWLSNNASKYGFQQLSREWWHWSIDGR